MSTWKIAATACAIALGFTATADARGNDHERPTFEAMDVDGSGEITVSDLEAMRANRFAEIDTNGDGSVTAEEFAAHAAARASERAGDMFARLDADGDGLLSRDALEQSNRRDGDRAGRMIERLDADNSGGVSAEEFVAFEEKMAERGERRSGKSAKKR